MVGKRERVPAQGVKVSDIPAGTSGERSMGGKREQAPVGGAEVSDIPLRCLEDDAIGTSEALTGKRERAPVGGAMASDIAAQSAD